MNNNSDFSSFETQIRHLAQTFPYPPTPDLAGRVGSQLRGGQRRWRAGMYPAWAWGLAVIILIFAGLMAVPSVRAAVVQFIQIGVIRIFVDEEFAPMPTPENLSTPTPRGTNSLPLPVISSPEPTTTSSAMGDPPTLDDLEGEMSLEDAQEKFPYPILYPDYPTDLGEPDKVYYQELEGGSGVLLIWFEPTQPDKIMLSLLLLEPGAFAGKDRPDRVEETTVNGSDAIWMEGEHFLILQIGPGERDFMQFFVEGYVLVWEIGEVTYRLESEFSIDEMIKIAESIQ